MFILVFILKFGKWWWKICLGGMVRRGGILRGWLCCDGVLCVRVWRGRWGNNSRAQGAGLERNLQQCAGGAGRSSDYPGGGGGRAVVEAEVVQERVEED